MNHKKQFLSTLLLAATLMGAMGPFAHAAEEVPAGLRQVPPSAMHWQKDSGAGTQCDTLLYATGPNCGWYEVIYGGAPAWSAADAKEASSGASPESADLTAASSASQAEDGDFYWDEASPTFPTEAVSPGEIIAETAQMYLGCDYVYGGSSPSGFDCSGFTRYVMDLCGYTIHRGAGGQVEDGVAVSEAELLPGDLVFFSENFSIYDVSHVGIYIGNDQFIHAATYGIGVVITDMDASWYRTRYVGARRIW